MLANHYEFIRNKKVVVFAFNAPYYLDSTDISKVSAYYGLYSKGPAFIDFAARLLFQEANATGASPVSIPGIGYDLSTAVSPDPEQTIALQIDTPETITDGGTTPVPTSVPSYTMGDSIPLRTSVILDHNHHPVPDGTIAKFIITIGGDPLTSQQVEAETRDGVARTDYLLQSPGVIEIRVTSDPAQISTVLRINIQEGQAVSITEIALHPWLSQRGQTW